MNSQQLVQQALTLAPSVRQITDEVLVRNIGRQDLIKGIWTALIAKHPVFALGSTGVNKTGTIRQMAERISGAVFDERLIPGVRSAADLFVASTTIRERELPDGSKETALNETLGRAADAHVFFGDEFFKDEDHPVLNALIDFALEGVVRHEGGLYHTPLMLFVAAGNETPDPQGKLAAVWSRMTLRLVVAPLARNQKKALVASRTSRYQEAAVGAQEAQKTLLTIADVEILQKARPFVVVPEAILDTVLDICDALANRSDADFSNVLQDDRRFGRIFDCMQAQALMAGRDAVTLAELGVLKWMLWDDESQIPVLSEVLVPYTRTPLTEAHELINALLSPTGALEAAKSGNIQKTVEALTQARAAMEQFGQLKTEAAGESAMITEIEALRQQVQGEMDAVIAKMTGRR